MNGTEGESAHHRAKNGILPRVVEVALAVACAIDFVVIDHQDQHVLRKQRTNLCRHTSTENVVQYVHVREARELTQFSRDRPSEGVNVKTRVHQFVCIPQLCRDRSRELVRRQLKTKQG